MRVYFKLAAVAPLVGFLLAQQAENSDTIFRSDSRLVVLHATAEDKDGHLVMDLPKTAFTVFESNVQQEIKGFRQEDVPVSLGLLIDSSASMTNKREKVAAAALALVKSSNPDDEVFIVNFDETPSLAIDFTNDVAQLERALSRTKLRGGTAMRDAVRTAIEHLKGREKKDKKVLVVLTDGNDNSSQQTLDVIVRSAQQNEVRIYSVGLLSEEEPKEAEKAKTALNALARATGGQTYYPQNISEIESITPRIAHEIRNQYIISYSPTDLKEDGAFRPIRVVVNAPQVANVRTRAGYYAAKRGAGLGRTSTSTVELSSYQREGPIQSALQDAILPH